MFARFIPVISKFFSKAGVIKEAWDWFSFANEAATALGLIKRGAAAVATTAVVAAPVVYTAHVVKVNDEKTKVYYADYLMQPANKELLDSILFQCKTEPDVAIERCQQAAAAAGRIRMKKFWGKGQGGW